MGDSNKEEVDEGSDEVDYVDAEEEATSLRQRNPTHCRRNDQTK